MKFSIPFGSRSHQYTREEIDVVVDVMRSSFPLTQERNIQAFEKKFREYTGARYAYAMTNATSAIEVASEICRIEEGDEVIVPAHTFTSSAYPFVKRGARIVWADIDLQSRVVTASTIERCISRKTKAIVVTHLYGFAAEMATIMELANNHHLIVIEDAAQALGVKVGEKMVGTFGDFGVFSFHSHKNITTLGEGGMLTARGEEYSKIIPMLRHNGHCDFESARDDYWLPAMGNVDLPEIDGKMLWPNNYSLPELPCAVGVRLLDRIDQINKDKRQRAVNFIDELACFPELEFHRITSERHNYHLLVGRLVKGDRDQFIRKMAFEHGIQCVVQYYPLYRYPFYKKVGLGEGNCPNTDIFFDNMISFPFHHLLSKSQLSQINHATRIVLSEMNQR